MTIIEAVQDRELFGGLPAFKSLDTWGPWLVFLSAVYGLPMSREDEAIFCKHTGRSRYSPPPGGYPESVCIVGRQSGKTRIASVIAAFEAACAEAEKDSTETYALLIAQDQRAALRSLFSYAKAPFETVPLLRRSMRAQLRESIALSNGCVLAAYPCRPSAVRGIRARVVGVDELAFMRSSENLPVDTEMLRAVRPTLATTGGKLIILSSPYGQSGALYELYRKYYGRDDSSTLIWQASAPEMNPTLPADYIARMEQDDPEAFRSEVLGEFRAGVSTFLDPDAIAACVTDGVRERPPVVGVQYRAFADPSGGRHDRFAVAIGHAEGERAVLDVIRGWAPPFNPAGVIAEACDLLRSYGVHEITGDRYSAEFVVEQFSRHGVKYRESEQDRSQIYLGVLPRINARTVALLDVPELLREFRGLERRRGTSGRDKVDHNTRGGPDDLSNAAAGVLVNISKRKRVWGFAGQAEFIEQQNMTIRVPLY